MQAAYRIISEIKLRWILSFAIAVIALHVFTMLNKTYKYNGKYFNSEQYHLLLDKSNQYARYAIAYKAQASYFYKYPDSIVNFFYSAYLLLVFLMIIMINRNGWGLFYFEMPPPRPVRHQDESVSVFATRLLEWTKLIKDRY